MKFFCRSIQQSSHIPIRYSSSERRKYAAQHIGLTYKYIEGTYTPFQSKNIPAVIKNAADCLPLLLQRSVVFRALLYKSKQKPPVSGRFLSIV